MIRYKPEDINKNFKVKVNLVGVGSLQLRHTRSDVGFLCEVFDAKFFSLETRLVFVARHCDRDGCHGGLLVHLELASRSDTQLQVPKI